MSAKESTVATAKQDEKLNERIKILDKQAEEKLKEYKVCLKLFGLRFGTSSLIGKRLFFISERTDTAPAPSFFTTARGLSLADDKLLISVDKVTMPTLDGFKQVELLWQEDQSFWQPARHSEVNGIAVIALIGKPGIVNLV